MERVSLGSTGITASRLAFGTGTNGWHGRSDQTALGQDGFAGPLRYAFGRGIAFWDMADAYGSHPHAALALKGLPREQFTPLTETHSRGELGIVDAMTVGMVSRTQVDENLDLVGRLEQPGTWRFKTQKAHGSGV